MKMIGPQPGDSEPLKRLFAAIYGTETAIPTEFPDCCLVCANGKRYYGTIRCEKFQSLGTHKFAELDVYHCCHMFDRMDGFNK
jgi:hypothetical protein